VDYAGACSAQRDGRCFRFIYDEHGKPTRCPDPLAVTGWVKIDRWHEVDACAEHAAQLMKPRPNRPGAQIGSTEERKGVQQ
jgi:hypothetical protein